MWTREELKERAKFYVGFFGRDNYWPAVGVCLVASLLGGELFSSSGVRTNISGSLPPGWSNYYTQNPRVWLSVLLAAIAASLVVILFSLAFSLFVGLPIKVGQNRYFIENRNGMPDFMMLFSAFRAGSATYLNIVKTMGLRMLYTTLWSLLFVIPGIVASYSYQMVPYILAENPNIAPARALEISKAMTHGEKLDIFILELSFLGWIMLGSLACGIGVVLISPYYEGTMVELYGVLRQKALATGICEPWELGEYPAQ